MDEPKSDDPVSPSDPIVVALGNAAIGVQKIMTKMTGVEYDPALSRILAIFAVGCFLNAGGHDLTQEQVDIIRGMLAENAHVSGLSGFKH